MLKKVVRFLFSLVVLVFALAALKTYAIPIDREEYLLPHDYFEKVSKNPNHPVHTHLPKLQNAFNAVVLIGGRATGVIVSPQGHMITARHTLEGLNLTTPEGLARVPIYLYHEKYADGSKDTRLTRLVCERLLVSELSNDFVLLKLRVPSHFPLPFAEVETDPAKITAGMHAVIAGHPNASDFNKSYKVVSDGPVVLYEPTHEELPHFLHLIDTDGGHSGAPVFSAEGKLIGLHFRGVPNYPPGVRVVLDGKEVKIKRFNVGLPLPYLHEKYSKEFEE